MKEGSIIPRPLKDGSIVYDIKYRHNGKQKRQKGGNTKKEAKAKLREILRSIDRGEYRPIKPITFSDFSKLWLEKYAEGALEVTTLKDYHSIIGRHLIPSFGDSKLAHIAPEDIQGLVAKKLKEDLSPKTVRNILVPLTTMLKHAVLWGYLNANPASFIEKPKVRKRKPTVLDVAAIRTFLSKLEEPYRTIMVTAALTGLRRGEVLALKEKDIDFAKSKIYIRRSFSRGKLSDTKSDESERDIPLPDLLASILLTHIARNTSKKGWLFVNEKGNPINGDNMYRRKIKPALNDSGLASATMHTLRHSLASQLIAQGASVKEVQETLGHADAQTTLNRYTHLFPNAVKVQLDRLAEDLLHD